MLEIAEKLGFKDLKGFRASLKTDPKMHGASADALLDAYRSYSADAGKVPELVWPPAQGAVRSDSVPDFGEKTAAAAYYEAGTPDGGRPGVYLSIPTTRQKRNLYAAESIAYHEGIPGHHLQISIAHELTGMPQFRKYSSTRPTWRAGGCTPSTGQRSAFTRILIRLRAAGRRHLARHPPCCRHRRPLPGLDPRPDGGLLPRSLEHRRAQHSGRNRPVYCMAQPGSCLQGRRN